MKKSLFHKIISSFIAVTFLTSTIIPPASFAQMNAPAGILNLPAPGMMIAPSAGFTPALIKGIQPDLVNPLEFNFIIDSGDSEIEGEALRQEANRLIKYFLASLTVPEDELWVNLSPYEKDRIIPDAFGETEMGRDLLAQDYILKQLTASLIHPEDDLGKEFWSRVKKKAYERFGTTDIPMNTFNKVWIVPQKAVVFEHQGSAYVVERHLKVMLEEDYLALTASINEEKFGTESLNDKNVKDISSVSSEIVREVVIPEIEKEVNQGQSFAPLRQIYNSMILAVWFKKNLRESILSQVYINKNKVKGVDVEDKSVKDKIYQQYLDAFRKGVYDFIKEDYDPVTQEIIPRKYFSGGFAGAEILDNYREIEDSALLTTEQFSKLAGVTGRLHNISTRFTEIGKSADAGYVREVVEAGVVESDYAQLADEPSKDGISLETNTLVLNRRAVESLKSERHRTEEVVRELRRERERLNSINPENEEQEQRVEREKSDLSRQIRELERHLARLDDVLSHRRKISVAKDVLFPLFRHINGQKAVPILHTLANEEVFDRSFGEPGESRFVSIRDIARRHKRPSLKGETDYEENLGNIYGVFENLALLGLVNMKTAHKDSQVALTDLGWVLVEAAQSGYLRSFDEAIEDTQYYHDFMRRGPPYSNGQSQEVTKAYEELTELVDKVENYSHVLARLQETNYSEGYELHAILADELDTNDFGKISGIFRKIEGKMDTHIIQRGLIQLHTYLIGSLMSPVMVALGMPEFDIENRIIEKTGKAIFEYFDEDGHLYFDRMPRWYHKEFIYQAFRLLETQGLVRADREIITLTDLGKAFVKRVTSYGVTDSYSLIDVHLEEFLFGDPSVLDLKKDEHMGRFGRVKDIWGSFGAHHTYMGQYDPKTGKITKDGILTFVRQLYNDTPLDEQPLGFFNMGSGDAGLAREVVRYILDYTQRGKNLDTHPLVVVVSDYNEAALGRQRDTMTEFEDVDGLHVIVMWADVTEPEMFEEDLEAQLDAIGFGGYGRFDLAHTEEFIPHERRLRIKDEQTAREIIAGAIDDISREHLIEAFSELGISESDVPRAKKALAELVVRQFEGSYNDDSPQGRLIPGYVVAADLIDFFKRWMSNGEADRRVYPLRLLELHKPRANEQYQDVPEDIKQLMLHETTLSGAYQGTHWPGQYILPYQEYKLAAALAGLTTQGESMVWPNKPGVPVGVSLSAFVPADQAMTARKEYLAGTEPFEGDKYAPIFYFGEYKPQINDNLPRVDDLGEEIDFKKTVVGGKGYGLSFMSSRGIREGFEVFLRERGYDDAFIEKFRINVPPGFIISTEQTARWNDRKNAGKEELISAELRREMDRALDRLEETMGRKLGATEGMPLLIAVRSGAKLSMPGMMDTILNLGLNDESVEAVARQINDRFAWDSYRRFIEMYGRTVLEIEEDDDKENGFHYVLERMVESRDYAESEYDLTADDFKELVGLYKAEIKEQGEAGLTRDGITEIPQDPREQYYEAVETVMRSTFNERAIVFRKQQKLAFEDTTSAVNVLPMIFGNRNERSGTGVAFTRDLQTGEHVFNLEYNFNAQGEDVVSGRKAGLPFENMQERIPEIAEQLHLIGQFLENYFTDIQDMEFTFEYDEATDTTTLYILQTRVAKRSSMAEVRAAYDMVQEGLITERQAVNRVNPEKLAEILTDRFDPDDKEAAQDEGRLLSDGGLNASPGGGVGIVVLNADRAQELSEKIKELRNKLKEKKIVSIGEISEIYGAERAREIKQLSDAIQAGEDVSSEAINEKAVGVILVRKETTPDDLHGMLVAEALWTSGGGRTSHAAVVSRLIGTPAVVGDSTLTIDFAKRSVTVTDVNGNTREIKEGEVVSVDGTGEKGKGQVYTGQIKVISSSVITALNLKSIPKIRSVVETLQRWMDDLKKRDDAEALSLRREYQNNIDDYEAFIAENERKTLSDEEKAFFEKYNAIFQWALDARDEIGGLGIGANAEKPLDVLSAVMLGAERFGLVRTEHMFSGDGRELAFQKMIMAENDTQRKVALAQIQPRQQSDFEQIFLMAEGRPVTIRLIDPPLHEFLPHDEDKIQELADALGVEAEEVKQKIASLVEENPMFGTRGVRLSVVFPQIIEMQVRAIFNAMERVKKEGVEVNPEVMVPLVGNSEEFTFVRKRIENLAREMGIYRDDFKIGTMSEIIASTLNARDIKQNGGAEFFSFGTNDLTQGALKLSRDDGREYLANAIVAGVYEFDPFVTLSPETAAYLNRTVAEADEVQSEYQFKCGGCGEQVVDVESIRKFLAVNGMDYVSGSPRRLPAATLAAVQEALKGRDVVRPPVSVAATPVSLNDYDELPSITEKTTLQEQMDAAVTYVEGHGSTQEAKETALANLDLSLEVSPELKDSDSFKAVVSWAEQIKARPVLSQLSSKDRLAPSNINTDGIGLLTTEGLVLDDEIRPLVQEYLITKDGDGKGVDRKQELLEQIKETAIKQLEGNIGAYSRRQSNISVRLPNIAIMHLFNTFETSQDVARRLAQELGVTIKEVKERIDQYHEANPAIGQRGSRLFFTEVEPLYTAMAEAIVTAAGQSRYERVDLILPFLVNGKEVEVIKGKIVPAINKAVTESGLSLDVHIGANIETPASVVTASDIVQELGSVTSDQAGNSAVVINVRRLTEAVWAAFEGDAREGFLNRYLEEGIWKKDIFKFAPQEVQTLIREAIASINRPNVNVIINAQDIELIRQLQSLGRDITLVVEYDDVNLATVAAAQAAVMVTQEDRAMMTDVGSLQELKAILPAQLQTLVDNARRMRTDVYIYFGIESVFEGPVIEDYMIVDSIIQRIVATIEQRGFNGYAFRISQSGNTMYIDYTLSPVEKARLQRESSDRAMMASIKEIKDLLRRQVTDKEQLQALHASQSGFAAIYLDVLSGLVEAVRETEDELIQMEIEERPVNYQYLNATLIPRFEAFLSGAPVPGSQGARATQKLDGNTINQLESIIDISTAQQIHEAIQELLDTVQYRLTVDISGQNDAAMMVDVDARTFLAKKVRNAREELRRLENAPAEERSVAAINEARQKLNNAQVNLRLVERDLSEHFAHERRLAKRLKEMPGTEEGLVLEGNLDRYNVRNNVWADGAMIVDESTEKLVTFTSADDAVDVLVRERRYRIEWTGGVKRIDEFSNGVRVFSRTFEKSTENIRDNGHVIAAIVPTGRHQIKVVNYSVEEGVTLIDPNRRNGADAAMVNRIISLDAGIEDFSEGKRPVIHHSRERVRFADEYFQQEDSSRHSIYYENPDLERAREQLDEFLSAGYRPQVNLGEFPSNEIAITSDPGDYLGIGVRKFGASYFSILGASLDSGIIKRKYDDDEGGLLKGYEINEDVVQNNPFYRMSIDLIAELGAVADMSFNELKAKYIDVFQYMGYESSVGPGEFFHEELKKLIKRLARVPGVEVAGLDDIDTLSTMEIVKRYADNILYEYADLKFYWEDFTVERGAQILLKRRVMEELTGAAEIDNQVRILFGGMELQALRKISINYEPLREISQGFEIDETIKQRKIEIIREALVKHAAVTEQEVDSIDIKVQAVQNDAAMAAIQIKEALLRRMDDSGAVFVIDPEDIADETGQPLDVVIKSMENTGAWYSATGRRGAGFHINRQQAESITDAAMRAMVTPDVRAKDIAVALNISVSDIYTIENGEKITLSEKVLTSGRPFFINIPDGRFSVSEVKRRMSRIDGVRSVSVSRDWAMVGTIQDAVELLTTNTFGFTHTKDAFGYDRTVRGIIRVIEEDEGKSLAVYLDSEGRTLAKVEMRIEDARNSPVRLLLDFMTKVQSASGEKDGVRNLVLTNESFGILTEAVDRFAGEADEAMVAGLDYEGDNVTVNYVPGDLVELRFGDVTDYDGSRASNSERKIIIRNALEGKGLEIVEVNVNPIVKAIDGKTEITSRDGSQVLFEIEVKKYLNSGQEIPVLITRRYIDTRHWSKTTVSQKKFLNGLDGLEAFLFNTKTSAWLNLSRNDIYDKMKLLEALERGTRRIIKMIVDQRQVIDLDPIDAWSYSEDVLPYLEKGLLDFSLRWQQANKDGSIFDETQLLKMKKEAQELLLNALVIGDWKFKDGYVDNYYYDVLAVLSALTLDEYSDTAMVGRKETPPGGIDLNPALLDLQIKRDSNGIPLPVNQQPVHEMRIEGFLPVIINVTPINVSLPMLLGLTSEEDTTEFGYQPDIHALEPEQLSYLK